MIVLQLVVMMGCRTEYSKDEWVLTSYMMPVVNIVGNDHENSKTHWTSYFNIGKARLSVSEPYGKDDLFIIRDGNESIVFSDRYYKVFESIMTYACCDDIIACFVIGRSSFKEPFIHILVINDTEIMSAASFFGEEWRTRNILKLSFKKNECTVFGFEPKRYSVSDEGKEMLKLAKLDINIVR